MPQISLSIAANPAGGVPQPLAHLDAEFGTLFKSVAANLTTATQETKALHEEVTREAGKLIDVASGQQSTREDDNERASKLEQEFAIAVFEIGLRQSSPKVLKGLMLPTDVGGLTTEHIKSHLQKYRMHYERSKEEFLGHYRKYLKLDRGTRMADSHDLAAPPPSTSSSRPDEDDDSERRQVTTKEEVSQLVKVQNVHNQLVQEQLELQNTLQSQMHEQLQLQAELNALMRDAASIPIFGPTTDAPADTKTAPARKRRSSSLE